MQNLFKFAQIENCPEGETGNNCLTNLPNVSADTDTLTIILGVVFAAISAVSVIIIIVQGIRFITASGDPEKTASARRGIIYAVIGLAISISANIIVVFFLNDVL